MDLGWGDQLHRRLCEAGLADVEAAGSCFRYAGGSPGAVLWTLNVGQLRDALLDAGDLSVEELVQYQALLEDPRITWLTPLVVATRGRQPANAGVRAGC